MGKFKLVCMMILVMPVLAYAYTLQIGYLSNAMMLSFAQKEGVLYMSTGMGVNRVGVLFDERMGLNFEKGGNLRFFARGGSDVCVLIAYNETAALLFSGFGEIGIEYDDFEVGIGVCKGVKALNYSGQWVNFNALIPEAEIGYSW